MRFVVVAAVAAKFCILSVYLMFLPVVVVAVVLNQFSMCVLTHICRLLTLINNTTIQTTTIIYV